MAKSSGRPRCQRARKCQPADTCHASASPLPSLTPSVATDVQVAGDQQLQRELVRRVGQTEPHTKFDIQRIAAAIDDGIELMDLTVRRVELTKRTVIGILLSGDRP